jgi:arylsulfatase A-like enzyme
VKCHPRFLAAAVMTALLVSGAAQAAEERPNIIFIYSDDHAPQAVGAYQGELDFGLELNHTPTPNIDRLAQQGMRFHNATVTNSICKPSRATVLTGQFGHLNGVPTNGESIDTEKLTFPKILQENGYQTAIIGKWHLGSEPQGFDYYEVLRGQGPYYNPNMRTADGGKQYTGYTSKIIGDRTIHWLENKRSGDEPFMLMMQHKAPHRNWLPGPDHANDYAGRKLPEPDTLFYDYSGLTMPATDQAMEIGDHMMWGWDVKIMRHPETGEPTKSFEWWKGQVNEKQLAWLKESYKQGNDYLHEHYDEMSEKELTRWKYQRYIKDYLRTIRGIDDSVGRVMRYLRVNDMADNTIVIYTSDQGFFLGENGWFDKRWMYEESLRIPLVVRWPEQIEAGSVDKHLVQNLDFAPTLLDLAGVEAPDQMQGRSLEPLMKGETVGDWRDGIYYQYYEYPGPHSVRRHYGVRTDRYKLIHFYREGTWELFDLKKDPEELNSVYGDEQYADVQKRLKQKIDAFQEQYDSPLKSK